MREGPGRRWHCDTNWTDLTKMTDWTNSEPMVWGLKLLWVRGGVRFLTDVSARHGTEKIRNLIRNIDWLLLTCDHPGSGGGFAENYRKLMGTHLSKRLIIPSKGSAASGVKSQFYVNICPLCGDWGYCHVSADVLSVSRCIDHNPPML